MTDDVAERARTLGGPTLHSIGEIAKRRRLKDNDAEGVAPTEMVTELAADDRELAGFLRATHAVCDQYGDVATASLIETWIDETERRSWFLDEVQQGLLAPEGGGAGIARVR